MIRNHSRTEKRSAFTIIELMVVVLIIVALAGMLFAGVMKVMGKLPEIKTRTEIGQMDAALAAFMSAYNMQYPPPSSLYLREDGQYNLTLPADQTTVNFLKAWLGRGFQWNLPQNWNGNVQANGLPFIDPPYILSGQQLLVFYLGGIPAPWVAGAAGNVVTGTTGFSTNAASPALAAVAGTTRNGPYFTFESSRLSVVGNFPVYLDAWQVKNPPMVQNPVAGQPPMPGLAHPLGTAYAFFSTQGKVNGYIVSDCGLFAYPYYETNTAGLPNYTYNNRYQIISAGKDGVFGGGVNPNTGLPTTLTPLVGFPWIAASGATGYGADDQSNFSSNLLGTGQQ